MTSKLLRGSNPWPCDCAALLFGHQLNLLEPSYCEFDLYPVWVERWIIWLILYSLSFICLGCVNISTYNDLLATVKLHVIAGGINPPVHTVQEQSRWKILEKGRSGGRVCGRKKPTASNTLPFLSLKGIVAQRGGGSQFWSFNLSAMITLFGRSSTCFANLWTNKVLPTPGLAEDTTRTFKLQINMKFLK